MAGADPFQAVVPLLVEAVPKLIASKTVPGPLCIVRLFYFDTHAPGTYLWIRTMSDGYRASLLEQQGRSALYELWASGEQSGDGHLSLPDDPPGPQHQQIAGFFAAIWERLCDEGEDHVMPMFQQTLQSACKGLNQLGSVRKR